MESSEWRFEGDLHNLAGLPSCDLGSSLTAAAEVVAKQLGVGKGSVRRWVIQAQVDGGQRPGVTTGTFGKDDERRPDASRLAALVGAYDSIRPLTPSERELLPDLLAVGAAAERIGVLTNWLRKGDPVVMEDSYSARAFLELVRLRPTLHRTFGSPGRYRRRPTIAGSR